jgi:acyl-CoA hydrolase
LVNVMASVTSCLALGGRGLLLRVSHVSLTDRVTAPRSDMMFVVTEFGLVNLRGRSIPERAKEMISLAHPDFRDDLARDPRTHGLIPR